MRVASLNTRKRLGKRQVAAVLEHWLEKSGCDLVVVQEPWVRSSQGAVDLRGFRQVGGNSSVYSWIHRSLSLPRMEMMEEWCQKLEVDYVRLFSVYLSPYRAEARERQLESLFSWLMEDPDRPSVVLGDFNTAPEPIDGTADGVASSWTSRHERELISQIVQVARMVDMTSSRIIDRQEYTIERKIRGREIAFRCDLALCSDTLASDAKVFYDHDVRRGGLAFTDHSAIISDIPITIKPADLFTGLESYSVPERPKAIHSHKTAMSRSDPSKIAAALKSSALMTGIDRVLDFGCGRGRDVEFYQLLGVEADGYDPHPGFGWTGMPKGEYGLVTMSFVLNVIPNSYERLKALRSAVKYLAVDGCLVVATRSPWSISREAETKKWEIFNDGFMSHEGRGTFQKGIGKKELEILINRIGLKSVNVSLDLGRDVSYVVARRTA